MNYYITQSLSGRRYFCSYLSKMGKVQSPKCIFCSDDRDDAYHTLFVYEQWKKQRTRLTDIVGEIAPETIVGIMISEETKWTAMAQYMETILRQKKTYLDGVTEPSIYDAPGENPTPPHNQGTMGAALDANVIDATEISFS